MFNSQKVNTDPYPWRHWPPYGGELREIRYASQLDGFRDPQAAGPIRFEPRPSFDNNPNPILVEFRNLTNRDAASVLRQLPSFYTPHIDHARKVLQRLANLTGTEM